MRKNTYFLKRVQNFRLAMYMYDTHVWYYYGVSPLLTFGCSVCVCARYNDDESVFIPSVPSYAQQVHGAWFASANSVRNRRRGRETTTVRGGVARLRPSARHGTGARASGSLRLLCQTPSTGCAFRGVMREREYIKIRLRNGQGFGGSPRGSGTHVRA